MIWAQLFRIVLAWRGFILLSAAGCCIVAVIVAAQSSPIYQSIARVEMDIIGPDVVTGVAIGQRYAEAFTTTQVELIRDYSVAGRVVDLAGFANSPDMAAQYRISVPSQNIDFRRWLAQQVIAGTSAGLIPESNILEIRYTATSPAMAATMAELIRSAYIDQSMAFTRDRAQRNSEWFAQEAQKLRNQLGVAQAAKTEFERENGVIIARDGRSVDEIRMGTLATTLPTFRPARQRAAVPAPSALALAEVEARIASASQNLGVNHPAMLQLREQQASLREAVSRETAALNAQPAPAPASQERAIAAQTDQVLTRAEAINEARRLATNVSVLEEQYLTTAKRAADLRLEAGSLEPGMVPIGQASVPSRPLSPNWLLVVGLSFGFGLALGVLTSLLLELLGMPVRSIDDLDLEGVPVLNAKSAPPPEPAAQRSAFVRALPLLRGLRTRQPV